jgi:hypothetical protein
MDKITNFAFYLKKMTTKLFKRRIRVMRLMSVVNAYHHYAMMLLNRELMQSDNSWQEAESFSNFMSILMPNVECSPTDFLFDKNEMSDNALDNYEEFKKWIKYAERVGVREKTLMAFCKNVYNSPSMPRFKVVGHILYPIWLTSLCLYVYDKISKTKLQSVFVEYSFSSGKEEPANLALFRKDIIEIEDKISQISDKQDFRELLSEFAKMMEEDE